MDLMDQVVDKPVDKPVVLDMAIASGDLSILRQAAETFGGTVEEIVKNETSEALTINLENFDQGLIPVGKSGFKITLPSELRGHAVLFWAEVDNLRERKSKKEAE